MVNKKDMFIYALISVLAVAQVVLLLLNFLPWLKIVLAIIIYLCILLVLLLHTKKVLSIKPQKSETPPQVKVLKTTDPTLLDIYAILKIAPQYNADGSLKDMYQLLGIMPEYDQQGNRIATVYEYLGINPMFNQNGQEIPYVLRIKNRVNSIVKLQSAPLPLIYISREQKVSGQRPLPILTDPILVDQKQEQPQLKQIPVVKPAISKPEAKKAGKPASVNYGGSAMKVSVSQQKIEYKALKTVSAVGSDLNLFNIVSKKPEKVAIAKEEPVVKKQEIDKGASIQPKVTTVLVKIPTEPQNNIVKREPTVIIESNKKKQKTSGFVEFMPMDTSDSLEKN